MKGQATSKRNTRSIIVYSLLILLIIGTSLYSHFFLQNNRIFIIILRILFPLFMTGLIYLSHRIYNRPNDIGDIIQGWLLMVLGGCITLFLMVGTNSIWIPGLVCILCIPSIDILTRRTRFQIHKHLPKAIKSSKTINNQAIFYGIVALLNTTTIALLTILF